MDERDFYQILGVDRTASKDEVKRAYRKAALRYHPDRNPDDAAAEERFKEAAEAYSVLGDEEKRSNYDRFGEAGLRGGQGFNADIFADFSDIPIVQINNRDLIKLGNTLNSWPLKPSGTEGYRTAEVTVGGVNTNGISSRTMEVKKRPGIYFVGEVLDVTGQLGGFNFQWAWASGYVAGLVA